MKRDSDTRSSSKAAQLSLATEQQDATGIDPSVLSQLAIKNLDHMGIIIGGFKSLGVNQIIDDFFPTDKNELENVATSKVVMALVLNAFCPDATGAISMTSEALSTLPLEKLFGDGVKAEYFNRHKLGRVLEKLGENGPVFFSSIARHVATINNIDTSVQGVDTTSFSLNGEYREFQDSEVYPVRIQHGYSKDMRPDLKQIILELTVTQDGGIPLAMMCHSGNASDSTILPKRVATLLEDLKKSPDSLISCVADCKLYCKKSAPTLQECPFITRVPSSFAKEEKTILKALSAAKWEILNEKYKYQTFTVNELGFDHTWIVVHSLGAQERAKKSTAKAVENEKDKLISAINAMKKQRYSSVDDARAAAAELLKKAPRFHECQAISVTEVAIEPPKKRGRPSKKSAEAAPPSEAAAEAQKEFTVTIELQELPLVIALEIEKRSCFVLASTANMSAAEVITTYKSQNTTIENIGFRFLKDPYFFSGGFFLKKPTRICGLIVIMTLALLIYSVLQRRLRLSLTEKKETLPNQIQQEKQNITLRYVLQCFKGIYSVSLPGSPGVQTILGMTSLREKILRHLGPECCEIYGVSYPEEVKAALPVTSSKPKEKPSRRKSIQGDCSM